MRIWLVLPLALAGCFTEVGNPDDPAITVTTCFSIDYQSRPSGVAKTAASDAATETVIHIGHFYLDVYDAEYFKAGTKYYLQDKDGQDWNDKNGNFVDITGKDTAARIPVLSTSLDAWSLFFFTAQAEAGSAVKPGNLDYAGYKGMTHMKGTVSRPGQDLDFLFQIPVMKRLYLVYRDTSLARLRTAEGYNLEVAFRTRYFEAGIPWDSVTVSKDKLGHPFALLSTTSNPKIYGRLQENFRKAFRVDSAQVDGTEPVPGF